MKEPNWVTANEETVWKFVAWHLAKNGIDTILVGGAVAAIYSDGIYKSGAITSIHNVKSLLNLCLVLPG